MFSIRFSTAVIQAVVVPGPEVVDIMAAVDILVVVTVPSEQPRVLKPRKCGTAKAMISFY